MKLLMQFNLDLKLLLDIDDEGENPLLLACANGSLETVKWLVEEKGLSLIV